MAYELFLQYWPHALASVVGLAAIIGMWKGWVSPTGAGKYLFWSLIYLVPPVLYVIGYNTKSLQRPPRFLLEDPSSVVAGGLTPIVVLGVAMLGAQFVAGGSVKAPLWRLISYLMAGFAWAVAATATATYFFVTHGLLVWYITPTVFAYASAAMMIGVVARNAWQRSPMEQHRSS